MAILRQVSWAAASWLGLVCSLSASQSRSSAWADETAPPPDDLARAEHGE
jgi:hypothetical protein